MATLGRKQDGVVGFKAFWPGEDGTLGGVRWGPSGANYGEGPSRYESGKVYTAVRTSVPLEWGRQDRYDTGFHVAMSMEDLLTYIDATSDTEAEAWAIQCEGVGLVGCQYGATVMVADQITVLRRVLEVDVVRQVAAIRRWVKLGGPSGGGWFREERPELFRQAWPWLRPWERALLLNWVAQRPGRMWWATTERPPEIREDGETGLVNGENRLLLG